MAARKQLWHPDEVRQKIQASQLINRLTDHALADAPIMDASQVNAAKILLGKAIPDLQSTTISGDPNAPIGIAVMEATDEMRARALAAFMAKTKGKLP